MEFKRDKTMVKIKSTKINFTNIYYGNCCFIADKKNKVYELRYTDYHDNKKKTQTFKKLKDLIVAAAWLGIPKKGYQDLLWIYFNI